MDVLAINPVPAGLAGFPGEEPSGLHSREQKTAGYSAKSLEV